MIPIYVAGLKYVNVASGLACILGKTGLIHIFISGQNGPRMVLPKTGFKETALIFRKPYCFGEQ